MLDIAFTCTTGAASGGNALDFTIKRSQLECAPEAIELEVDLSSLSAAGFTVSGPDAGSNTDPRYRLIDYYWEIDDNIGAFNYPVNLLSAWNNASRHYGPYVVHTCPTSGTKNITLTAVDKVTGHSASRTKSITVLNADDVYSGTGFETVCLSTSGDFTGAPAGATLVTASTLNLADQHFIDADTDNTCVRFLFRAGETFDMELLFNGFQNAPKGGLFFGRFGAGAKPVINAPVATHAIRGEGNWEIENPPTNRDLRITGLRFEGNFDPSTDDPATATGTTPGAVRTDLPLNTMVYDVECNGLANASFNQGIRDADIRSLFSLCDVLITNHGGQYPLFVAQGQNSLSASALVGVRVNNSGGRSYDNSYGAILRDNCSLRSYVSRCDLMQLDYNQPVLKIAETPENEGGLFNVVANYLEGGTRQLRLAGNIGQGISNSFTTNALFRHNICVGQYATSAIIMSNISGLTIEGNLCRIPDGAQQNRFTGMITSSSNGTPAQATLDQANWVIGNLVANLRSATDNNDTPNSLPQILNKANDFTWVEEDNVQYVLSTKSPGPLTTDTPLSSATLLTPYIAGFVDPATGVTDPATVPTDPTLDEYRPEQGNPAIGNATEIYNVLYRELDLSLRGTGPRSRGPWEPAE